MRESYIYPSAEEPYKEVARAVDLDNFYEKRWKKKMPDEQQLINKFRPITFDEVLGNKIAVQQLAAVMKTPTHPHAFLFSGPTGVGKTTLARIIGKEVNAICEEVCAATNSGIDDTRNMAAAAGFRGIMVDDKGKTLNKMIIIDEAHNLSDKAWEPFLKLIEDPPKHLYIAICTTEPNSVPDAIKKGRCYPVPLKGISTPELEVLIQTICDVEGWKVTDDVFSAICQAANGSARFAVSILQAGHALTTRDELSQIIEEVEATDEPIIQLMQYLVKGGRAWIQVSKYLERVDKPEAALGKACNWLTVAFSRSQEKQAKDIYRMLRAFTDTQFIWNKKVQLYAAVGKMLFGEVPF